MADGGMSGPRIRWVRSAVVPAGNEVTLRVAQTLPDHLGPWIRRHRDRLLSFPRNIGAIVRSALVTRHRAGTHRYRVTLTANDGQFRGQCPPAPAAVSRVAGRAFSPFSGPLHHFPWDIPEQKPQLLTSTGRAANTAGPDAVIAAHGLLLATLATSADHTNQPHNPPDLR